MGLIMHEPYIHASGSQFPGSRSSFPRAFFSISTLLIAFISLFFYSLSSLGRRRGSQLEEMTEIYAYFIREILKGCAAKCLDRTNSYTNDNGVIGVSCESYMPPVPDPSCAHPQNDFQREDRLCGLRGREGLG